MGGLAGEEEVRHRTQIKYTVHGWAGRPAGRPAGRQQRGRPQKTQNRGLARVELGRGLGRSQEKMCVHIVSSACDKWSGVHQVHWVPRFLLSESGSDRRAGMHAGRQAGGRDPCGLRCHAKQGQVGMRVEVASSEAAARRSVGTEKQRGRHTGAAAWRRSASLGVHRTTGRRKHHRPTWHCQLSSGHVAPPTQQWAGRQARCCR